MDIEELTTNHILKELSGMFLGVTANDSVGNADKLFAESLTRGAIKKWLRRPWTRPPWQSGRRKGIQTRKARNWLAGHMEMNWYQYDQESGQFIQISGGLKVPFFGVVDSE